ncbi:MAG: carboxypeptidase-like regulatory domain-containing protein [Armatimonadota bacterium]
MMRWIAITITLLATLSLFGCNGGGRTPPGIYGQVISKGTRQPIASATVSLQQDSNEIASVQTNESGKFAFPNLSPGTYTLVVSADGYWRAQVRVTLEQGRQLSVTIEMFSEQEGPPTDVPITD